MRIDCTHPLGGMLDVLLDGVPQEWVKWADPESGKICRIVTDENGHRVIQNGCFVTEEVAGVVRFSIRYGLLDLAGYLAGFPEVSQYMAASPP